jgi:DNA-binding CsgD family transcriptional regulator/tetratricopeptide (TPR) repeat protein
MVPVRENSRAPLFEREAALRILGNALDLASKGHGSVVSIVGDAGLGKTALVNAFCRRQRGVCVLRGLCDALSTPRPLGPIRDIARDVGGALEKSFAAGRDAVFDALLAAISADKATLLVVEDAHWADEATLDLIRFLGRRLRERRCLLIITTRRQDSATRRSLTHILSVLPTGTVQSINLEPLSPAAVEAWAASLDRSAESLHAMTGGNPFFVSELLQSKGTTLPGSVRDAVLASAADLPASAREVLDQCAVIPGELDAWLVETLWPAPASGLTECLDAGMLVMSGARLGFRHELARRALFEALARGQARRCHERVLNCLLATRPEQHLGRIVHHAAAAGRAELVSRYGVDAAREAAAVGAHREAASHWARTLEYGALLTDEKRAEFSEAYAYELYLTGQIAEAQSMRERALELWLGLQNRVRIGDNTRWLSRIAWAVGDRPRAADLAERAVERLEQGPACRELAYALSNRSMLAMLAGKTGEALEHGARALELAQRLGDWEIVSHALNNIGTAKTGASDESGWADLEASLAVAVQHNLTEQAARAFTNIASRRVYARDHARAEPIFDQGIAFCERLDLDFPGLYLHVLRAQSWLDRGEWNRAQAGAAALLELTDLPAISRIPALVVAARVKIRRGQLSGLAMLDQAFELARATGEIQRLGPIAATAAEATWLGLAPPEYGRPRAEVLDAAVNPGEHWYSDQLAFWTWRAFGSPAIAPRGTTPYVQHMQGDARGAAEAWAALGCPYERAIALLDLPDSEALSDALELVEELGATPLIQRVRRKARPGTAAGSFSPTPSCNGDITPRQHEILILLSEGLTNDAIGRRLFLSPKTVGHHVEAILQRLSAKSRTEAVFVARQRGLLTE